MASLRAILPDIVDEVKVGDQLAFLLLNEFLQLLAGLSAEQRRIKSERAALRELLFEISGNRRGARDARFHEADAAVFQFYFRLHKESAVGPDVCFFLQNNQGAGISGKTADFTHALIAGTDVLTAVCIGIRLIIDRDSTLLHRLAKLFQFFSHIGLLVFSRALTPAESAYRHSKYRLRQSGL